MAPFQRHCQIEARREAARPLPQWRMLAAILVAAALAVFVGMVRDADPSRRPHSVQNEADSSDAVRREAGKSVAVGDRKDGSSLPTQASGALLPEGGPLSSEMLSDAQRLSPHRGGLTLSFWSGSRPRGPPSTA